ncbi:MAG: NYN domain-containing protein [Gemmatimonadota bacterium]|nr:NYN domain-containing protein [Gemmatimonadota bacterium]
MAPDSLHAALLIDFDNVTMGMRSNLSKELKTLLESDVIKVKVSVQRAYADWRRYPQYIVPLSEASVDLIFAPAYGSNKKNATDIRMAIDALELVFTRPEIGTFILLTGDSDFSSLVLKLKEYGKYVIGVGIQESSSDILVQNCDEYYSYTSLTGLTKTTDLSSRDRDPWVLVKEAVAKMVSRSDVMRSDRLKQVMQELEPSFDEGSIGFSKFSKFLAEASSRGLVKLHKVGNGQYEIRPTKGGGGKRPQGDQSPSKRERGRGGRKEREEKVPVSSRQTEALTGSEDPLRDAYAILTNTLERLKVAGRDPARDSDVKRKILEQHSNFDEAELGFPKFSRFLSQAADHGVIHIERSETGNFDVSLPDTVAEETPEKSAEKVAAPSSEGEIQLAETVQNGAETTTEAGKVIDVLPTEQEDPGRRLGPRRGSTRRRSEEQEPLVSEDQSLPSIGVKSVTSGGAFLEGLGLPNDPEAIVRYLTHRYRGVGEKTAKTLVERFGSELFVILQNDPAAVSQVVPANRAEQLLEAWGADYERRSAIKASATGDAGRNTSSQRRGRSRSRT